MESREHFLFIHRFCLQKNPPNLPSQSGGGFRNVGAFCRIVTANTQAAGKSDTHIYTPHQNIVYMGGFSNSGWTLRCPGRWQLANHSRANACKTPTVNLIKSTFNLIVTLNLNVIPHKNNQKWLGCP